MAVFHNGFAMRRRWFVLLMLVSLGLTLCIGFYLWHAVHASSIVAIQTRIEVIKPILTTMRCLVIGLVILSWPIITRALHRWGCIDEAGAGHLMSVRWHVAIWLVVIELMLGQNLLGSFLAVLQEASA